MTQVLSKVEMVCIAVVAACTIAGFGVINRALGPDIEHIVFDDDEALVIIAGE